MEAILFVEDGVLEALKENLDAAPQLVKDYFAAQAANTALTGVNADLQGQVSTLTETNTDLQEQVSDLTGANTGLQGQVSTLTGVNTDLQGQVSDLTGNLEIESGKVASLTTANTGLELILSADEAAMEDSDHTLVKEYLAAKEAVAKVAGLVSDTLRLYNANATLTTTIDGLDIKVIELETEIDDLEADLVEANAAAAKLADDLVECEAGSGNVALTSVSSTSVSVFPNPTASTVTITTANGETPQVRVFNSKGAMLQQIESTVISLDGYANGVYVFEINGETISVVKQ